MPFISSTVSIASSLSSSDSSWPCSGCRVMVADGVWGSLRTVTFFSSP